jgi:hypothetical protein
MAERCESNNALATEPENAELWPVPDNVDLKNRIAGGSGVIVLYKGGKMSKVINYDKEETVGTKGAILIQVIGYPRLDGNWKIPQPRKENKGIWDPDVELIDNDGKLHAKATGVDRDLERE